MGIYTAVIPTCTMLDKDSIDELKRCTLQFWNKPWIFSEDVRLRSWERWWCIWDEGQTSLVAERSFVLFWWMVLSPLPHFFIYDKSGTGDNQSLQSELNQAQMCSKLSVRVELLKYDKIFDVISSTFLPRIFHYIKKVVKYSVRPMHMSEPSAQRLGGGTWRHPRVLPYRLWVS